MNRLLGLCVVLSSCAGPATKGDVTTATPTVASQPPAAVPPVVADPEPVAVAPPPVVAGTGRTCDVATFVGFDAVGASTVQIYEVAADCTTRSIQAIELEGPVFDAAWPRRDQPLALATAEYEAGAATDVLVFDQPLLDAAHRPAPRKLVPPGTGKTEPEGYVFGLVTDGKDTFVERCTSWGDNGGSGGEEVEEWDCRQHVYFALGDKAGRKARPRKPAPRDAFTPVFAGGTVPGTGVELRAGKKALTCTLAGVTTTLDPWGAAYGGKVAPLTVIPLSASDYLLGTDNNGSRMRAYRSVRYDHMRGCEDGPFVEEVMPGPGLYWAELERDKGWHIRFGGDGDVLDANGKPVVFTFSGMAWTQP